jgi:hypothetical protein
MILGASAALITPLALIAGAGSVMFMVAKEPQQVRRIG